MLHLKSDKYSKCQFIIFELISTLFMIIASILIIIQGFDNDNFRNYKTREIKTERLLFTQLSHEVYSNIIFSYPFYESSKGKNLAAEIKINSFFDCRGVRDNELNEFVCQNKINNNWTCCRSECCFRTAGGYIYCNDYNFDLDNPNISNNKILSYDYEEFFEDPRRRFCTYYNNYDGLIDTYFNKNLKIENFNYNYEDLLLNKVSSVCLGINNCNKNYIDCGIIDTMNRHLYAENASFCPVNNIENKQGLLSLENKYEYGNIQNKNHIILRNIISEIPPTIHDYKNKTVCQHEKLKNEEITIRDINKLLKHNKTIYRKIEKLEIPLNSIGNAININKKLNSKASLNWYSTNYIGFKTVEDLEKFKKVFNISDDTDNPVYKLGENIYPYIKPIIIIFPILFLSILYIIFILLVLFQIISSIGKKNMLLFIIRLIILLAMLIIEIIFYVMVTDEFEEINIDIDENYKEILDLYNKRRLQLKYFLSIIFLALAFVPVTIWLIMYFECFNRNIKKEEIKKDALKSSEENIINEIENVINIQNNNIRTYDRLNLRENWNIYVIYLSTFYIFFF